MESLLSAEAKAIRAVFSVATESILGDGKSTLFCTDRWIQGESIKSIAPALFPAVPNCCLGRMVAEAVISNRWVRDLVGALTVQVLLDYLRIWGIVQEVHLDEGVQDRLVWRWTSDGNYSATSAYRALFAGSSRPLGAKELWKVNALGKVKHFLVALHKRCWTAVRRHRHGLQDSRILCPL